MKQKFECIEQLLNEEIIFTEKSLLYSLEAYLGRDEMIKALEYISRIEDWHYRINESGEIELNHEE